MPDAAVPAPTPADDVTNAAEIERIRARATAADYEPTAEDVELCQSGECGGCFVCYGRPMLMFGEGDVRLLLAEIERLRAGVSPQPEITTVDGRQQGQPDAVSEIARFFCHELAGEHAVPNDTHRDVAIDLLSELRAAGLVYDGPQPEITRQQPVTQFGQPLVLITTEHNDQTDESVVDASLPIVDVPPDTELVLVPLAVWALLVDGAIPTTDHGVQLMHGPDCEGCQQVRRMLTGRGELARRESCGQPAAVRLPDGSTWCEGCDETARRFGYDDGATPAGPEDET